MITVSRLVTPPLGITIVMIVPEVAVELESIVPLRDMRSKLEKVKADLCQPLLLIEPKDLEQSLGENLPAFTFHLTSVTLPVLSSLLLEPSAKSLLRGLIDLEKKAYRELEVILREQAPPHGVNPQPIIKMHAAAIDYDIWAINAILDVGFKGFMARLLERARTEAEHLGEHLYPLLYALTCVDSAILEGSPHRKDTLEKLVKWGFSHANEVEDYIDTLSLLISDEAYEALAEYLEG